MMLSNGKYHYDIEVDEGTHWALVKLAAEICMHQEDYVEQLLKAHCEDCEEQRNRKTAN